MRTWVQELRRMDDHLNMDKPVCGVELDAATRERLKLYLDTWVRPTIARLIEREAKRCKVRRGGLP